MRILVIEDDREAAAYLVKGLTESGHRVDLAEAGATGSSARRREASTRMIIDRMLPGLDGLVDRRGAARRARTRRRCWS